MGQKKKARGVRASHPPVTNLQSTSNVLAPERESALRPQTKRSTQHSIVSLNLVYPLLFSISTPCLVLAQS